MEKILFRGKRKDSVDWAEGFYVMHSVSIEYPYSYTNGKHCIQTVPHNIQYEVLPETVCQFTGLQDKDGKKIFEGDIVKTKFFGKDNGKGQNFSDYDVFKIVYKDGAYLLENSKRQFSASYISDMAGSGAPEVIGNIFDNPELIGCGSVE